MSSLGSIPAFRALPSAVLDMVAVQARAARFGPGTVIRPAGQRARAVVLLLAGTVVAADATSSGGQVWTQRWVGPAIVDKPAVLDGGIPSSGLVAITAISVRLLPGDRFLGLLEQHRSVRQHVLGQLARDVTAGRQRLVQAVTLPAIAQVASWLYAQDQVHGVVWRGSQEHLAHMLGLSRVTVNRALARLASNGAIWRTPGGIVVADRERLEAFANGF